MLSAPWLRRHLLGPVRLLLRLVAPRSAASPNRCRSLLRVVLVLMSVGAMSGCGSQTTLPVAAAGNATAAMHHFDLQDTSDFDEVTQATVHSGYWSRTACANACGSSPAHMTASLHLSGTSSYTVQGELLDSGATGSGSLIGINTNEPGLFESSARQHLLAGFRAGAFGIDDRGTWTELAPRSGFSTGAWYAVTLAYTGKETIVSATPSGTTHSFTAVLPGVGLAQAMNLQVESFSSADEQRSLRYAAGSTREQRIQTPYFSGTNNLVTAVELEQQGGSFGLLPPAYRPGGANRWVLYFHGYNESGAGIFTNGAYNPVVNALVSAGYVVIAMNNTTQNCYGNAQCAADIRALMKQWSSYLSLAPAPFVMADSMGGFTMLNAMSRGALAPAAAVGWSINTNLGWDYESGGASYPITQDYGISASNPYAAATAGYDPLLADPAVYAGTPMMLWSSYEDTVVPRPLNTDAFAEQVNAAGGNIAVRTATGNHLDGSNFDPATVVQFFNAH